MHFSIQQKELEKSLDIASTVVAQKVINPALQGTLFTTQNSSLTIQASDGEVFFRIQNEVESKKPGTFLVKGSILKEIVKTLGPTTSVEIQEVNQSIKIQTSSSRRKTSLNLLSLEDIIDFPNILDPEPLISLNALEFKEMIAKTLPFAAKEEIRFTFNSLLIQKDSLEFRIVSSDTKRLALTKVFLTETFNDFSILIPSKTGQILKDMITSSDTIEISKNKEGQIIFKYRNILLVSPQVDGMFPDYRAVIPKETPYIIDLSKNGFADVLRGFAPFYTGDSQKLLVKISKNMLTLTTDETELGVDENQIDIDYTGEDLTLAFNYKFLKEIFNHINESDIQMKILAPDKPVIFEGKGNQNTLFVCVPMKMG